MDGEATIDKTSFPKYATTLTTRTHLNVPDDVSVEADTHEVTSHIAQHDLEVASAVYVCQGHLGLVAVSEWVRE